NFDLTVRWIPGHKEVEGNELADVLAKEAAEKRGNTSMKEHLPPFLRHGRLPDSAAAIKQWHQEDLRTQWSATWKRSPRYAKASTIDASMPSKKF
ncbi:hypothetical protein DEU56DRAFT_721721, partial [Suillus clintonianus]|uniref:uncharacterized protein n=1 Tax=Suillus clintonianus TaxID=1904413 RepID=UPI001B86B0EC